MIGSGGGAEDASSMRVKCALGKFRELSPILTARRASLKLKGKVYRACVQSVMVQGRNHGLKVGGVQKNFFRPREGEEREGAQVQNGTPKFFFRLILYLF